jgi:hypothetical protein
MNADTAAAFTRDELSALYSDNHYGRDTAGQWRQTPPLETLDPATATAKCEAAIAALLSGYYGTDYSGASEENGETNGPKIERRGIEALRHYTEAGIKLLPCIPDGNRYRPIVKKENWTRTATADIEAVKKYMKGGELWTGRDATGADLRQPITLFRFIPKDNGLVILDIDRGHSSGGDGAENFYKWLEAADIYRPQLPSYLQDFSRLPCYVTTPKGGLHLVFTCADPGTLNTLETLETEKQLTDKLAPDVELFFDKPTTAAGSARQDGEYILHGDLAAAIELDPIILRRVKKTPKPQPATPAPTRTAADRPGRYPQTFTNTDLAPLRARLVDYLHAKGYTQKQGEFIPCLCHTDGATPNMFVNADFLYCHSCKARLDVFGAAAILDGIGTDKKNFPKTIEAVKMAIGA